MTSNQHPEDPPGGMGPDPAADAAWQDIVARLSEPSGPRDYSPAEDDDDGGYVPPEPPPLGVGEPLVVLAWLGAAGGPIALLLFSVFWRSAPLAVTLGIVAAFVASVCFLILRLPKHREHDDDGAAV
jgi:hypothetical protein